MIIYDDECVAAGKDPRVITEMAREFSKLGRRAKKMGLTVFGGSGSGSIRFSQASSDPTADEWQRRGSLIIANIDGPFDGGDGACQHDKDGLLRGE